MRIRTTELPWLLLLAACANEPGTGIGPRADAATGDDAIVPRDRGPLDEPDVMIVEPEPDAGAANDVRVTDDMIVIDSEPDCIAERETCDGVDNDCDGEVDEDFPDVGRTCDGDGDEDACAYGLWRCADDGAGVVCAGDEPVFEICNGRDDDCDGAVDEDVAAAPLADRQTGVCAGAVKACAGEEGWVEPSYAALPGWERLEEACDGLDNDCDVRVDAGLFPPPADLRAGVCAAQVKVCAGEAGWAEPDYAPIAGFEPEEGTCDGEDNDCDGEIDEALVPPPCELDLGVCASPRGPAVCAGADGFTDCDYGPDYEVDEADACDALDNDCDGEIDEAGGCPLELQAVRVEPGAFTRGSPEDEAGRDADEVAHPVELTRALLVRRTEVTQAEWLQVMGGDNPAFHAGADRPVEQVAWRDAIEFCNALSAEDGLEPCYAVEGDAVDWTGGPDCGGWRLPTEAEWEHFARAGSQTPTWAVEAGRLLTDVAWFRDNSESMTQPVGELAENPFGLHDVLGNVAEWVWDRYGLYPEPIGARDPLVDPLGPDAGATRIARGSTYLSLERRVRSANRAELETATRNRDLGLRPVRTAP